MSDWQEFMAGQQAGENFNRIVKHETVGETIALMVSGFKMVNDKFNPGKKTPIVNGKLNTGDEVTMFLSKRRLGQAVGDAVKASGAAELLPGGILSVTRTADVKVPTPEGGVVVAHTFDATYTPPGDAPAAPAPAPVVEEEPETVDPSEFFKASA